jgi:tRNA 2-thiouridine synthesizing protein A
MRSDEETTVDASGRACPEPVLMLRQALAALAPGTRVVLLATDPLASVDVHAWCARTGQRLIEERRAGDALRFVVEKA